MASPLVACCCTKMNLLGLAAFVYPVNLKASEYKINPSATRILVHGRRKLNFAVTVATDDARGAELDLEYKKHELLGAIQETKRGFAATADQRSVIEEALVCVEGYNNGDRIDLAELNGTWRLQYTSASDVLALFEAASRLSFFQVGQIFQKFDCKDRADGGTFYNVIRWSVSNLLEDQEGGTLIVSGKFDLVSNRNLQLQFDEVTVKNLYISEQLQALIAPAILPRSFLSLEILQFIRAFKLQIPLRAGSPERRRGVSGLYYLSYLDRNMLLGRSLGGSGVFVFTKSQPLDS